MKKLTVLALMFGFIMVCGTAFAEDVTVTYTIPSVATITKVGDPAEITLAGTTAGAFDEVTETFSVDVAYNGSAEYKITADINSAIGTGATMTLLASTCPIGTASAVRTLCTGATDNGAQDMVTDLANDADTIVFTVGLTATMAASTASSATKTITLTLTSES